MAVQARSFPQTMPAELHRNLSTAVGNRIRSDIEKQPAAQRSADTHGTVWGGGRGGQGCPGFVWGLWSRVGNHLHFKSCHCTAYRVPRWPTKEWTHLLCHIYQFVFRTNELIKVKIHK